MRYIKKIGTDFERRGVECSQNFINECWKEDEESYVNLQYDASKLDELRKILVEEEECICCYCMRRLYIDNEGEHKKNVTLEHIIPHRIKVQEWNRTKERFLQFECLNKNYVKVCYEGKLDDISVKIKELPHPHCVSFHNLVASCDGETFFVKKGKSEHCCNINRQERFVLPIFFFADIEERFGYDKEGKLDYGEEFEEQWFDKNHLNLSSDWLNSVRLFWYKYSLLNDYNEEMIEKAITDKNLRLQILDDVDPKDIYFSGFDNDRLWGVLSEYKWFYNYYKNNYAQNSNI